MRLISPIDGVVTKRNVDMGEMVAGNQFQTVALLTIARHVGHPGRDRS